MDTYPIARELRAAFRRLFADETVPEGLLGKDGGSFPASWKQQSLSPSLSVALRARQLRTKLEGFVVQMARERDELGPTEGERLRAEATATLVALRELALHFPEALEDPEQ
jgi:hypothetical protein